MTKISAKRASSALALGFSLLLAGCSGSQANEVSDAGNGSSEVRAKVHVTPALHRAGEGSIADVVDVVLPSVVSVTTTKHSRGRSPMELFFGGSGRGRPQQGLGSGVVLTESGIVVTNNHVIAGADEVQVQTHDEREFSAKVIGSDPKSDVAVLQLEGASELTPIAIGDSSSLRLGEVVLAVGYPFGVGQTVTMGIVSATGRSDMGIVDYENFIQTDAAINPGNSGGALINMKGELVGINTAILSRSGGSMGIGFAIPMDMAEPIVSQLRDHGKVSRGWLGVRIQDLDSDLKKALSLGELDGVLVSDVEEGSPAEKGGVRSGDVVTHVDGKTVGSTGQLRNQIAAAGADAQVMLTVRRTKKTLKLKVDLGALPKDGSAPDKAKGDDETGAEVDGLSLKTLDADLRKRLKAPGDLRGAVVTRVAPHSKAARAKLRPGDVILQVNRKNVSTSGQAEKRFAAASGPKLLQVWRRGSKLFVVVK